MTAMLVPAINSYFAIYTMEGGLLPENAGRTVRGLNWDLHATATDRAMAISHARMLAMQPGVAEVHVKQVTENLASGIVSVRDVTRCKRSSFYNFMNNRRFVFVALGLVCLLALLAVAI